MVRVSKRWKAVFGTSAIITIVVGIFSSHYIQLALKEHISLREFIIRTIKANQNLDVNSSMYGSFFNNSWQTLWAIDVLEALQAISSINKSSFLAFLVGSNKTGLADLPLMANAKNNVDRAFIIVHTAYTIGEVSELPASMVDMIKETIRIYQNATYSAEFPWWMIDRYFLFETARILNQTRYINFTLQSQDIINSMESSYYWNREIGGLYFDVKALEELSIMKNGLALAELHEVTRNFLLLYVASLWSDTYCGFYESFGELGSRFAEPTLESTSEAVLAYEKVFGTTRRPFEQSAVSSENKPLIGKVGRNFENLLTFLQRCQNRYGLFFNKPSAVDDSNNSFQLPLTYYAVSILRAIKCLDFLNQTVRWPAQPTIVEAISDLF